MIAVRPLSIAELFDRAVTLVVRRWSSAAAIALIVSIPGTLSVALVATDPQFQRHQGLAYAVLQLMFVAGLGYGFAALALLFAGADERPSVLRLYRVALSAFWRLLRVSLATGLIAGIALVLASAAVVLGASIFGAGAAVTMLVACALVAVPFLFVLQLAFADAVLEGTGAAASIGSAFRRAFSRGLRVRTSKLAYAATCAYLAPQLAIGSVLEGLASATRQPWLNVVAPPLETSTGFVFAAAITTLAAVDYRVRREGADLEAALDLTETA